mmetsp:Transcript_14286/g.44950  ORF Transcript_14286/g.44950 Transcript_14286/m.44950 type:complete len:271 (-) Transcript_14286:258-1070(-)
MAAELGASSATGTKAVKPVALSACVCGTVASTFSAAIAKPRAASATKAVVEKSTALDAPGVGISSPLSAAAARPIVDAVATSAGLEDAACPIVGGWRPTMATARPAAAAASAADRASLVPSALAPIVAVRRGRPAAAASAVAASASTVASAAAPAEAASSRPGTWGDRGAGFFQHLGARKDGTRRPRDGREHPADTFCPVKLALAVAVKGGQPPGHRHDHGLVGTQRGRVLRAVHLCKKGVFVPRCLPLPIEDRLARTLAVLDEAAKRPA